MNRRAPRSTAPIASTVALLALALPASATAQEPQAPQAYPERDILSPFRDPQEIQAPADAVYEQLATMRRIAESPASVRRFDDEGREVIDDDGWLKARRELRRLGVDAGMLAQQMRFNRNADQRELAFYGAFYCDNVDHVFNLIAHIPGEPVRQTREKAYPRAIEFLRAHIGRTFGDLSAEEQESIRAQMPTPGSPEANARGIVRLPLPGDTLFGVNLKPFFQLLDLDDEADQAQGLWFLKECFALRHDLALAWLEPALPRVRQLLISERREVREQALGLFAAIAPDGMEPPADADDVAAVDDYADRVTHAVFPPIRRISDGLMLLLPSTDRDQLVRAGTAALDGDRIGAATYGKTDSGQPYRGFRVDRVPEDLEVLGIPEGAIVTAVNGVPVNDGPSLLRAIEAQFQVRDRTQDRQGTMRTLSRRTLVVEILVGNETRAIEYRVM